LSAEVQDHFHLMTTYPDQGESTAEYEASAADFKPSLIPQVQVFISPRWSRTGKMWPHILKDGANPVQKDNFELAVLLTDYSDLVTWLQFSGKEMYFVPNYHDQAVHQSYAKYVLVSRIGKADVKGVKYDSIILPIELLDLSD